MNASPTVNITIVTQNRLNLTRICLESLLPTLREGAHVTVVDNGSGDGSLPYLEGVAARDSRVTLVPLPRNMGVAIAANLGWASRDCDYYCKLDNDVEILRPDWLDRIVDLLESTPEVGMAGYCMCDWHGRTPVTFPSGRVFLQSLACNGACAVIPRKVHAVCGFWNEDYGRYGYEDLDYNNRVMLAGLRIGYLEDGENSVRHLGFTRDVDENREAMKQRARSGGFGSEKLYLINKFLFEQGVRAMHVPRKYLPEWGEDGITFHLQDAYRPLMQLQQRLLREIPYSVDGDTVSLDFSGLLEKTGVRGKG